MGMMMSTVLPKHVMADNFILTYLTAKGATPFNFELVPGGGINADDDPAVIRYKFRQGLLRQQRLDTALREIQRFGGHRCMSPCLVKVFQEGGEEEFRPDPGFGNFDRLLQVFPKAEAPRRESGTAPGSRHILPPQKKSSESSFVERIVLNEKKKKSWPSKDHIRKILKTFKTQPTSCFLARFRSPLDSSHVEIEYCFNKVTNQEHFAFLTGSFQKLFNPSDFARFQADLANNNYTDDKSAFVAYLPFFFHELDGRIWWNGFISSLDGSKENRMLLKEVAFDPPSFVFDATGLRNVSATKTLTKLYFAGDNSLAKSQGASCDVPTSDEGIVNRKFFIRGRTPDDLSKVEIKHEPGTRFVQLIIPVLGSLSGIPVRSKSTVAKEERQVVNLEV